MPTYGYVLISFLSWFWISAVYCLREGKAAGKRAKRKGNQYTLLSITGLWTENMNVVEAVGRARE